MFSLQGVKGEARLVEGLEVKNFIWSHGKLFKKIEVVDLDRNGSTTWSSIDWKVVELAVDNLITSLYL